MNKTNSSSASSAYAPPVQDIKMNWYDASEEDGNLYAEASALGANQVVLASKTRVQTYLTTKSQGKHIQYSLFHLF